MQSNDGEELLVTHAAMPIQVSYPSPRKFRDILELSLQLQLCIYIGPMSLGEKHNLDESSKVFSNRQKLNKNMFVHVNSKDSKKSSMRIKIKYIFEISYFN